MSDAPRRPLVEALTHDLLTAIIEHPNFETLQIREIISGVASLLITLIAHIAVKYVSEEGRPAYRLMMASELRKLVAGVETGFYEREDAPTQVH